MLPTQGNRLYMRQFKFKKLPKCSSNKRCEEHSSKYFTKSARKVFTINHAELKSFSKLPVVILDNNNFHKGQAYFLIDTGSQLNLIKEKAIAKDINIDTSIRYNLTGIA